MSSQSILISWSILNRLETLRRSHATLCELLNDISSVFQPVILFNMTLSFFDLLNGFFYGIVSFLNFSGKIKNHVFVSLASIVWSTILYCRIFHVITLSEDSQIEVTCQVKLL
jgi:hypothetical protein